MKTIFELWEEIKDHLNQDAHGLEALKVVSEGTEKFRLHGKAEGVKHALSRMSEYERMHPEVFQYVAK